MFHDWSYEVQAIDARGVRLPVDGVETRLLDIVRDVELREAAGESPVPIGRLTADHRDLWAAVSLDHEL